MSNTERLYHKYPWIGFNVTLENLSRNLHTQGIHLIAYITIPPQEQRSGEIMPGMYNFRVLLAGRTKQRSILRAVEGTLDGNAQRYEAEIGRWEPLIDLSEQQRLDLGINIYDQETIVRQNSYIWFRK